MVPRGLAAKFTLAIALVVVVSVGAVSLFAVSASRRSLREQVLAANLTAATLAARAVEQYVAAATSIMREVPGRPKLGHEVRRASWPEAAKVLENFLRHFPQFDYVFIQDPQGVIRVRVPPADTVGQDFSFRDFFREVMRTRAVYVSGVYVSKAARRPVVSIAVPVLDGNTVKGVLVGALSLRTMSEALGAIGPDDTAQLALVDRHGALIAHSSGARVDLGRRLTGLPIVQAVTAGRAGAMEFTDADGTRSLLGAHVPIASLGWGVVATRPASIAFAPATRLARWLVGIAALCAGLAVVLGWRLARALTGPMTRLAGATDRIAAGDFDVRLTPEGRDEVAGLAVSFNRMAEQLGASYTRLESAVADRTRRLDTLVRSGLAITASLDVERVLHEVVAAATRLMEARSAILRLKTPDGRLEVRASVGMSDRYLRESVVDVSQSAVAGQALARGETRFVEDLALGPDLPLQQALLREGIRSMVTAPLSTAHGPIGVLTVLRQEPHRFSEVERAILALLAEQAAIALDRARLHGETEERGRRLAAQTRELEAFTYTVSHDLKAPLRGMEGFARAVLEDYADRLDEDGRRYLTSIQGSARRMAELIDDLLRYSRIERRPVRLGAVALRPLVDRVCAELHDDIDAAKVRVDLRLEVESIEAEPEGLREVVANLLTNAVKFSRDTGGTVTVGARRDAEGVVVWVADQGIGFDMKYHDRIFSIFERLHREEAYPGTGVGLAIVRKVAERHGGRAWAESVPGQGSTFFLALPQAGGGA